VTRGLVMGVGHSGTNYAAGLLNAAGAAWGHETVFDFDPDQSGSDQRWAGLDGDASLAAWSYIDDTGPVRLAIVRRRSVDVVRSWLAAYFFADVCPCHEPGEHLRTPYWNWMTRHLPQLCDEPDEMSRAMRYVIDASARIWSTRDHPNVTEFVRYLTGRELSHVEAVAAIGIAGARRRHHDRQPGRAGLVECVDPLRHPYAAELGEWS
jgi:hypothetical protein